MMKRKIEDQAGSKARHHEHLLQGQPKAPRKAKALRNSHQPLVVAG